MMPLATRAIRTREVETGRARTPIIALTANVMAHQVAEYWRSDGWPRQQADRAARLFEAIEGALAQGQHGRGAVAA